MKLVVYNVMYRTRTAAGKLSEPVQIKVACYDQNGIAAVIAGSVKIASGSQIQIDSATTVASEVYVADGSSNAKPAPCPAPVPPAPVGPKKLGYGG